MYMETLIASIAALNQKAVLKHGRLATLVTELEAKQLGLAEVTDVVILIEALTCGVTYHTPTHRTPTFTLPVLET